MEPIANRPPRLVVGVGGGIAAYKVCTVVSTLFQLGWEVRVMMTESAQRFVTATTFSTLARHPTYGDRDFWQATARPLHIDLGEWADLILLAPLTAHTLAKLSHGLADNLLTNTILASTCPVLLAPAMNTDMWQQRPVQHNWQQLLADPRYHSCSPTSGLLACDRVGTGRMAEPEVLIDRLQSLGYSGGRRDLLGQRVLISAGGTREFLDPVRYIGNPSSGKMGLALARAAAHRGALVDLVYGTLPQLPPEPEITPIAAPNSEAMAAALLERFPQADTTVMVAAVADVKPAHYSDRKLTKQELPLAIPVVPVMDIAAELGRRKQPGQKLIGFAAQTGDILTPARAKLEHKQLDAIVANAIDLATGGFGSDDNQALWIPRQGEVVHLPLSSKLELAHRLWDAIEGTAIC